MVIEDQEFTTPQMLEGYNPLTIRRNVFRGNYSNEWMLGYRNCSNVTIEWNKFLGESPTIRPDASAIVGRSTGSNQYVKIRHNIVWDIGRSGIVSESPTNFHTEIYSNDVRNTGTTDKHHGIYFMSQDTMVYDNYVHLTTGNCIAARSSGQLLRNLLDSAGKSCIRIHTDHIGGPTDELLAKGNRCFGGGEYPVVYMSYSTEVRLSSPEPLKRLLSRYIFTKNEFTGTNIAFQVGSPEFGPKNVTAFRNTFRGTFVKDFVDSHFWNKELPAVRL